MGRKLRPGRCVYCLRYSDDLTSDHAPPKSWYADTTPIGIEKWQVPACRKCNSDYGKIERRLLVRLGLCIDPTDPRSQGVADRAVRSVDPSVAKGQADRTHRAALREKVRREIRPAEFAHVLPGFQGPGGPLGQLALPIRRDDLGSLAEKLVRAITYVASGAYIDSDYQIEVFFLDAVKAEPINELISRCGEELQRGPMRVRRAVVPQDASTALVSIEVWGRLTMHAVVRRKTATIEARRNA